MGGHERNIGHAKEALSPNSQAQVSAFGSDRDSLDGRFGQAVMSERESLNGSPSSPGLPSVGSQPNLTQKQSSGGSSLGATSYIGSTVDHAALDPAKMWDHVRELKRKHKKTLSKLEQLEVRMAETKIQVR